MLGRLKNEQNSACRDELACLHSYSDWEAMINGRAVANAGWRTWSRMRRSFGSRMEEARLSAIH